MSPNLSRRELLRYAGSTFLAGTAATVAPDFIPSQSTPVAHAAANGTASESPNLLSTDPQLHLLRRITFGLTPELIAHVQSIGMDAFIEEQLAPELIDDSELEQRLAQFSTLTMSNADIVARHKEIKAMRKARKAAAVSGASVMDELSFEGQGSVVDGALINEDELSEVLVDDELVNLFVTDVADMDDLELDGDTVTGMATQESDAHGVEALSQDGDTMIVGASASTRSAAIELIAATQLRAIYSKRQLFELMVDFWSNHFNIHIASSRMAFYKTSDDRDVIRVHALGRFADMLRASAQSPAMLVYLDNARNKRQSPNENYARELMELHTLGVDGGYTEEDVRQAAYLLTGWSIGRNTHEFSFKHRRHHTGPLQIMDWSTEGSSGPNAVQDGIDFLDYLAYHPATARHLATKLCIRFISDDPPTALIDEVAAAYLANDTEIKPMLRVFFSHPAFWAAAESGNKFRRPFEHVAAVLRAMDASIEVGKEMKASRLIHNTLRKMAQPLYGWPAPDGYPDEMSAWLSEAGTLERWNFVQRFVFGKRKKATRTKRGISVDFLAILGENAPQTAGEFVDAMTNRLLHQSVDQDARGALLGYVGLDENAPISAKQLAYKAPQLASLILNSPHFQYR